MTMKRARKLLVIGLSIALLAAGCGGDDDDSTAEDPEEVADPNGVIRQGLSLQNENWGFDPAKMGTGVEFYTDPVMASPLSRNEDGEMVPDLATEVEVVNPKTFRVELRPDLVFSDG